MTETTDPREDLDRPAMLLEDAPDALEEIAAMFVQTAITVECAPGRMVLKNVSKATLFFSDRPHRVVGHMRTRDFVTIWEYGENSFASNPPNAVLAFIEEAAPVPDDVVVLLRSPVIEGDDLSYAVDVLEGSLPVAAYSCTLFIDPFGTPLTHAPADASLVRVRRRT
jgi:hypothetical protein